MYTDSHLLPYFAGSHALTFSCCSHRHLRTQKYIHKISNYKGSKRATYDCVRASVYMCVGMRVICKHTAQRVSVRCV